jgi:chromosome partitioning protein
MMIIAIANTKGGVGKTTLTVQLATMRALANKRVWVVDADQQSTSMSAISARMSANIVPSMACSHYINGQVLRDQVRQQKGFYDDVFIDVGGRDSSSLRAALVVADVLLIPFSPRSFDVWALEDMAALVEEAKAVRDNLKVYLILNLADSVGSDNDASLEAVKDMEGFECLTISVKRRKAIANASSLGLSVVELKDGKDAKAIAEITQLYQSVFAD